MSWIQLDRARQTGAAGPETLSVSPVLRAFGNTLRVAFILCLLVLTVRVSMPQNETIWTAYDTPGDLVRLALGFAVCVWVAIQLFRRPKDAKWLPNVDVFWSHRRAVRRHLSHRDLVTLGHCRCCAGRAPDTVCVLACRRRK